MILCSNLKFIFIEFGCALFLYYMGNIPLRGLNKISTTKVLGPGILRSVKRERERESEREKGHAERDFFEK